MANIERGMREIEVLTDYLNDIIVKTGRAIDIDNHKLWRRFFHHWTNEDWENMLAALDLIQQHYPEVFQKFHRQAILEARSVLSTASDLHRILDTKPHKSKAWRVAMSVREIVNELNGVVIPNGA